MHTEKALSKTLHWCDATYDGVHILLLCHGLCEELLKQQNKLEMYQIYTYFGAANIFLLTPAPFPYLCTGGQTDQS